MTQSRNKRGASHIYAIISTTLVLFLTGIALLIFLHGSRMVNEFKESIEFSVILKDDVDEESGKNLAQNLATQPYVKSVDYVSKEAAAKRYIAVTGDDFSDVLDYNPLYASVNMTLHANYANADSLKKIESSLAQNDLVEEFYYDKRVVDVIDRNIDKAGIIVGAISLLLLLVTVFVIDSTMRLAMYANRFTIRSMQLVGATRWFIVKPFISRSIIDGLVSAAIAILALGLLLNLVIQFVPELYMLQDAKLTVGLFMLVGLVGITFTLISTYFAVNKYLHFKLDDLY
jgi:cell division transport system permease protein